MPAGTGATLLRTGGNELWKVPKFAGWRGMPKASLTKEETAVNRTEYLGIPSPIDVTDWIKDLIRGEVERELESLRIRLEALETSVRLLTESAAASAEIEAAEPSLAPAGGESVQPPTVTAAAAAEHQSDEQSPAPPVESVAAGAELEVDEPSPGGAGDPNPLQITSVRFGLTKDLGNCGSTRLNAEAFVGERAPEQVLEQLKVWVSSQFGRIPEVENAELQLRAVKSKVYSWSTKLEAVRENYRAGIEEFSKLRSKYQELRAILESHGVAVKDALPEDLEVEPIPF